MSWMAAFASKSAPSPEKVRGGYYTPARIASFLAEWVIEAGPRLLEPSCGDGAILAPLSNPSRNVVGVELDPLEAQKARAACPSAEIIEDDFFNWFSPLQEEAWDGVAGNPPFVRFQHWVEPTRGLAFDAMRRVGMRPNKLTNAWVPFVVASALAVRQGGRVGLVLPAELMQVTYAAELRGFLVDEFEELTVVTFRRLVFEDILQEVVLLLGVRGPGPARITVVELEDADDLPKPIKLRALPHAPALRHEAEKWTKYFLDPPAIDAIRAVRDHGGLCRLGDLADVDVGIVTGRNQFFVLRPSTAVARGVGAHTQPLVSKSAHLSGVVFGDEDLTHLERQDALCRLLALDQDIEPRRHAALEAYIAEGEAADVHTGYKCSIRKKWWVVPSVWTPDAFLLRQIHDHPRIIANLTAATSTDTIHRVRMLNGTPPTALAAASINSATFAFSEVLGRSYGGGVLELEPREAEALLIPDPRRLTKRDVAAVHHLLTRDGLIAALDLVDEKLLVQAHGISPATVAQLRGAWERLRDRRLRRGRSSPR